MKEDIFFSEEELDAARQYWRHQLSGEIDELEFTYDFSVSPGGAGAHKDKYKIDFPLDLSGELSGICRERDLLLYIITTAVFYVLLYRLTGQDKIVMGSPIYSTSGDYYDYNRCIPLIVELDNCLTFRELLGHVKQIVVEGYKNQHYSIDNVLASPGISPQDLNYIKMLVQLDNIHQEELIEEVVNSEANVLTVSFVKSDGTLEAEILYNPLLFKEETIHRLVVSYLHIFRQVLSNRDIKIGNIQLVTDEEREKLLFDFNDTAVDYSYRAGGVVEFFEGQVEKTPHYPAVVFKDQVLTYQALDESAGRLASSLLENGASVDTLVGLALEYSLEMIIGILGILKSGAAYLPIDPGYPGKRIDYMLKDSAASVLVTSKSLVAEGEAVYLGRWESKKIFMEDLSVTSVSSVAKKSSVSINSLAYVIYTSGSTGEPRGVMIEHRSLVNFAAWRINKYGLTAADRTLQLISVSFDGFGANLYPSLLSGGSLVLPDGMHYGDFKYINRLIIERNVTHMSVVPIMYRATLENSGEGDLKSLRMVVLAGEKPQNDLIESSISRCNHITLINEYGPTEAAIAVAAYKGLTTDKAGVIGKPADNTKLYVLDRRNKLLPVGMAGELCINGICLARGYANRVELTAEKFFPDPYFPGEMMYKSGDRTRWLPDGCLEFLGRMDNQVKIRGYRVEPREIEIEISKTGLVKEVVVNHQEDKMAGNYLCAYFTPFAAGKKMKIPELRKILLQRLPEYMIPSRYIQLENIPLTPNGKIDRKALKDPGPLKHNDSEFIEPTSRVEKELVRVWQSVLNVKRIGIKDNFFELGGNSFLLMRVNTQIEELYPACLNITDFFAYPTIAKLTAIIEKRLEPPGNKNNKIEIISIPFPPAYFEDEAEINSTSTFTFEITGDLLRRVRLTSQKEGVETADILLSVYIYLFAKITNQPEIVCQTMLLKKNRVIPLTLNLDAIEDFPEFFQLLVQLQQENEKFGYLLDDIDKIGIKKEANTVIPFFYRKNMLTAECNLLNIFDIILEVEEESNRLSLVCEFSVKLRRKKVEEFIHMYLKMSDAVINQYLEWSKEKEK